MKTKTKYILILLITVLAVSIDLITKQLFSEISYTKVIPHLIAFQTNGGNTGAAFGLFSRSTVFLIIGSIIILTILLLIDRSLNINSKTYCVGLGLVLAGGIGNLVDRIGLGYVRDFIMFDFWRAFPIFNFADCCIVIGVVLISIYFLFMSSPKRDKATTLNENSTKGGQDDNN